MKKKTLTIAIALVLVVALAVGATYAYLTAKTQTVTNTFVAGKIIDQNSLKLYEHNAVKGNDGTYTLGNDVLDGSEGKAGNTYTIMPGVNLPKDPTVEVAGNTSTGEYYLFVKVTEGAGFNKGILGYKVTNNWLQLKDANGNDVPGVYVYTTNKTSAAILTGNLVATKILAPTADANDAADNTITVKDTDISGLSATDCTLVFQAYACQAAGLTPYAAYQAATK